jgi:hypothetical protein
MNPSTQNRDVTFTAVYIVSHACTACHKNVVPVKQDLKTLKGPKVAFVKIVVLAV